MLTKRANRPVIQAVAVGVRYCVAHEGIANEDDEVCDFYERAQSAEDNEADGCDFAALFYVPSAAQAKRGRS